MVAELNRSLEFYRDVIGLTPSRVKDSNVEFDTGQATLVLEEDFDRDVLDTFGLDEPGDDRGRGSITAIEVESPASVDKICSQALEVEGTVRMDPTDVSWGRRMALLSDPDGYTIEVSAPM